MCAQDVRLAEPTRDAVGDQALPPGPLDLRDRTCRISHLRVLDENGALASEREPDLCPDDLVRLYRAMVLAWAADDRMLKLQRQGRIGTFPPTTGQEAAACGPTLAMTERDWFAGSFRETGGRLPHYPS